MSLHPWPEWARHHFTLLTPLASIPAGWDGLQPPAQTNVDSIPEETPTLDRPQLFRRASMAPAFALAAPGPTRKGWSRLKQKLNDVVKMGKTEATRIYRPYVVVAFAVPVSSTFYSCGIFDAVKALGHYSDDYEKERQMGLPVTARSALPPLSVVGCVTTPPRVRRMSDTFPGSVDATPELPFNGGMGPG